MDDILASIRKIIADDFSNPGGLARTPVDAALDAGALDDLGDSNPDVLDLGAESPLVHSLSGGMRRQVERPDEPQTEVRRDDADLFMARSPNVTALRSANDGRAGDQSSGMAAPTTSDRHVRSVSERLSTLRQPTSASGIADPLLGKAVEASVSSAFKSLQDVSRRPVMDVKPAMTSPTLESVVVEALKPMLREWLDANLPLLVEELVKAEIQRLSERR